jgi:hypothetical protein
MSDLLKAVGYPLKVIGYQLKIIGRNHWLLVMLILTTFRTSAQVEQTARFEKEQKSNYKDFTVISMGEQGLALIRDKQKFERGDNFWEIILLDSALAETWTHELAVESQYRFIGHDYRDENLYFLFRIGETDQGKLKLVKIKLSNHQTEEHNYETELALKPTHFNIVANYAIYAGYVNNDPTVLLFNLDNNQTKIVPGLAASSSELLDLRVNVNNTFNVLLSERQQKTKKRLIAKTFDQSGAMLLDDVINVDTEKSIISGFTSTLVRDELMIVGTWGEGSSKLAAGIFTVLVDPYSDQKINYYDFGQLTHFFEYMSAKRAAKTKEKANQKRAQGKVPDYRSYVLAARLEETKDGFLFYTEAYYSSGAITTNRGPSYPYSSPYSNPYGYTYPYRLYSSPYSYGYPYGGYGNTSSNETKMLLGSLVSFDAKGNLVADHGFKFEEMKLNNAEQVSDFYFSPTKTTLVFSKGKEIHFQTSQTDGVSLINQKIQIRLNSANETIRGENGDIATVRGWYKKNLYSYGYQSIKNTGEGTRDVFYINKITVE